MVAAVCRSGDRRNACDTHFCVADKPSCFGGRTAHVTNDFHLRRRVGEMICLPADVDQRGAPHLRRERQEERTWPSRTTPDQLCRDRRAYDRRTRRGAQLRYGTTCRSARHCLGNVKGPPDDDGTWSSGTLRWGSRLTPPGVLRIAPRPGGKVPGLYLRRTL